MKKFLISTVLLFFIWSITALAYEPIPSYKYPINRTQNFIEKIAKDGDPSPKGKRDMLVQSSISSGKPTMATLYAFSTDGTTVVGPYVIYSGQTIIIPIDDRQWGLNVVAQGNDHVYISVWIIDYYDPMTVNTPSQNEPFQNNLLPETVMESFYNS